MGIFDRMGKVISSNFNALLDKAEDPQKMLDQLVRDYTNSIVEAEEAAQEDAQIVTFGRLGDPYHPLPRDGHADASWRNFSR